MVVAVTWISQAGTKTKDNRDCAGVGLRRDGALCIVLDGSTSGPGSGDLARKISRALVDWYVGAEGQITSETLIARIRAIHGELAKEHRRDSASYMIAHCRETEDVLVLHAGDCLLGRYDEKAGTDWVTRPHTLANVDGEVKIQDIVGVPARQRLTRGFRAREFMVPDVMEMEFDTELVMATDGFWAELSGEDQHVLLGGGAVALAAQGDDRSVLRLRASDSVGSGRVQAALEQENIYVRSA
jgi:serine/threonine protein phosphatase PrpC